jgi:hypothetical protein
MALPVEQALLLDEAFSHRPASVCSMVLLFGYFMGPQPEE